MTIAKAGFLYKLIGSLVPDGTGTFYGAALGGGTNNFGYAFSLTGTGFVPE
jgi:hypothetical protein